MPCPFFEPQRVVRVPEYPNARVPLLEEYDGVCRAAGFPVPAPEAVRFRWCNHGYSRGSCPHFPANEIRSAIRFDVLAADSAVLTILFVQEQEYAPLRHETLRYTIAGEVLEPEMEDLCARAQALAFCRSFVRRFAS
jgi:hypothetical protein